ncbi:DUF4910 domain-containing protein [Actinocorallia lasiicapitis]
MSRRPTGRPADRLMSPADMHGLVRELYPLNRSITGDGVRRTLELLDHWIPLELHEVATGTDVLDWTVPREWNAREAWIKTPDGRKIADFAELNLHLVGYSVPLHTTLPLAELRKHLHTLPDQPDLVPYRTSYYQEDWGFCLTQRTLDSLEDGDYEVHIDTTLEDGSLTYAEHVVRGRTADEVLISCHICHPSLANDNLAGVAVAAALARGLKDTHYTYRFVFAPGTIGAITWLARNPVDRIRHGLTLACAGDPGRPHWKLTRRGDHEIDRVFRLLGTEILPFTPYGYDERQYGSPGFDLPVGSLTRTPYAGYPEYHTSGDDPGFVRPEALADTLALLRDAVEILEHNRAYTNLSPHGEPQLGRRGLYGSTGGRSDTRQAQMAMLWVLNLSDGDHDLLAVAARAGLPFPAVLDAARALEQAGLLKERA